MKLLLSSRSFPPPHQPLEQVLGCLILVLCVSAHFFALGSKADPELLAYDESQSWQVPVDFIAPTASEVLFASKNTWQSPASRTLGMTEKPVLSLAPGTTLGAPLQATALQFEAALVALNFRF